MKNNIIQILIRLLSTKEQELLDGLQKESKYLKLETNDMDVEIKFIKKDEKQNSK